MKRSLLAGLLMVLALSGAVRAAEGVEARREVRRTPIVTAVERVRDCVVNISTERIISLRRGPGPSFGPGGDMFDRLFEDYFRGPVIERRRVQSPLGSGAVITPDGLVITNEHVVRRASNIQLSLDTGETIEATLLAVDVENDLALLRAKTDKSLKAIPLGSSSDLMLGETVIALGNPFGFENSVTSGIVSAFNREIDINNGGEQMHYSGLIQTSALINPGNSGGPLVNVLGELVGINSAVVDQAQGIGFAVPIDRARDVLAPLLATAHVSEAWSGAQGETVEGRLGARITEIEPKSPADGSLRPGDVVTEIDGLPVRDLFDFHLLLVQRKPGDAAQLRITRDGKTAAMRLTLGRLPEPSPERILRDKLGLAGQDLTPATARQLGTAVDAGLLVTEVFARGPAAATGLIAGDVIVKIGPHPVRTVRQAASALRAARMGEWVSVLVVRQNQGAYARILIGKGS